MPKLKAPVVNNVFSTMIEKNDNVELVGNDYGEFHPTIQILSICDLPRGGVFRGVNFNIQLDRATAIKYIRMTEKMKPQERIDIDSQILKSKKFAAEVFSICSK